ncbi:Clavaminate synthase-like protein [Ascobolus immersus RN42]|uniref:Clavaminate synthase-like protein n=1 Tax=Ascobolus immersus RN42 TaxID=1160509 RepID=A0A3N4HIU0_ASCIM|nr:Clavaminate synthase-like protein [Ascobolus immersus RN42]
MTPTTTTRFVICPSLPTRLKTSNRLLSRRCISAGVPKSPLLAPRSTRTITTSRSSIPALVPTIPTLRSKLPPTSASIAPRSRHYSDAPTGFPPIRLRSLPTLSIPEAADAEALKAAFKPAFTSSTPVLLPTAAFTTPLGSLPSALSNWIDPKTQQVNTSYFDTLEKSTPLGTATVDTHDPAILGSGKFTQSHLPLTLYFHLLSSTTLNRSSGVPSFLYLSQHPIPNALKPDTPAPALAFVGRGDIYATTMWAAYTKNVLTSLHWDPNHNVFLQVAGRKRFRLIKTDVLQGGAGMTELKDETDGMERWVWGEGDEQGQELGMEEKAEVDGKVDVFEVEVKAGEGLFIPRGWWHSVRGGGNPLSHNVSVNWWFR